MANVEIRGIDTLRAKLNRTFNAQDVLQQVGSEFVKTAQSNAPVDTGYMKRSIQVQSVTAKSVTIKSSADYSAYVEHGTRYMRAQPFFDPALNTISSKYKQLIQAKLEGHFS